MPLCEYGINAQNINDAINLHLIISQWEIMQGFLAALVIVRKIRISQDCNISFNKNNNKEA